jgi:hypothetical protein
MPEWRKYRGKALQYKEALDEIFTGTAADGRYSQSADILSQIDPAILGVDEDREDGTPPPTQDLTQFSTQGAGEDGPAQSLEHEGIREKDSFASRALTSTVPQKRTATIVSGGGKKAKRTVQDSISDLVNIIDRRDLPSKTSTPRHLAIRSLQLEYPDLNNSHFRRAVTLLSDDLNVEIFLALGGTRRDDWLMSRVDPDLVE